MPYSLGPVKPHVQTAADRIGGMFKVKSVLGWGLRSRDSEHPLGLALDFMVGNNQSQGNAIAAHVAANAAGYGVKYYIWQQHIYNFDRSGKPSGDHQMEDRGSATENHRDHVHVSFYSTPGTGDITGSAVDTTESCAKQGIIAVAVGGAALVEIVHVFVRAMGG